MELGNLDLCILTAYLLKRNWGAQLNLITTVSEAGQVEKARDFLVRLTELARIPSAGTSFRVFQGSFPDCVSQAPQADLNIFGVPNEVEFNFFRSMVEETRASCAFLLASGEESALA